MEKACLTIIHLADNQTIQYVLIDRDGFHENSKISLGGCKGWNGIKELYQCLTHYAKNS